MPSPAELSSTAVSIPAPELRKGEVYEDATAPGQEIKCIVPSLGREWTSDPVRWHAVVTPAGFFYPKRGDEAVLAYPLDAPPYVTGWWPDDAASPDVPL